MPAPLIGITTYGPDGDALPRFSLPQAYVDAVVDAGGRVVLLAPSSIPPEEALDLVDGLVLAGGGDVDPQRYGGAGHPSVYGVNPARDAFELELASLALARADRPLLGICRGMQVMNVALGGDLQPHIPDAYGESVVHRLPPREPTLHTVRLEAKSVLERIYGCLEFPGCSWHHQALGRLAPDLRAVGWAPDRVVEAVVHERHPFALGVQWHPEMQVADDPLQRRLFEALVARAREGA